MLCEVEERTSAETARIVGVPEATIRTRVFHGKKKLRKALAKRAAARACYARAAVKPTVLLFDIDGTLVDTGGAGRRAMIGAFLDVTGRADACAKMVFAGMTDRAIGREGLANAGREPTEELIDAVLEAYLWRLERELVTSKGYRLMSGVEDTLAWLAGREGVAVGLGTGNIKRGAYKKLARGRIDSSFRFGGFGCDAEDRAALLSAGARRGAEALGAEPSACRVVVIGDTPKDVAAALRIGAECLAVAAGSYPAAELAHLGATWAVDTMLDPRARDALLGP